jgi:ABC-2 type transport system permease protein
MTTAVANPAATGVTYPSWRGTNVPTQIMVLTGRSLRAIIRDPRMIVFSLLQPLVMLLLFSQIFASIAKTPGFRRAPATSTS